ncbi:MAG: preprotein translocase subunit SecG [Agarilytica sp.]
MENLIILFHVLVALVILGLILLQQGKGAEMGASFGSGSSQTLFGASGSGNFFAKMTAICAFVFFVTSFSLAVIAKQNANIEGDDIPSLEEIPAEVQDAVVSDLADDLPAVEDLPEMGDSASVDDIPELPVSDDASEDLPTVPEE